MTPKPKKVKGLVAYGVWKSCVWYCPSLNRLHVAVPIGYDGIDKLGTYFYSSQFDEKIRRFYLLGDFL